MAAGRRREGRRNRTPVASDGRAGDRVKRRPRFVPPELTPRERRVYLGATGVLVVVFCALIWPVYPLFAGIRPLVLGVPLSLAWVVAWLLVSFVTLLALFLWEGDRGGSRSERGEDA